MAYLVNLMRLPGVAMLITPKIKDSHVISCNNKNNTLNHKKIQKSNTVKTSRFAKLTQYL